MRGSHRGALVDIWIFPLPKLVTEALVVLVITKTRFAIAMFTPVTTDAEILFVVVSSWRNVATLRSNKTRLEYHS